MKIEIRGEVFTMLPERALYWEKEHALICSDLHWGREAFLQTRGFAIPEGSFEREAKILKRLIEKTKSRELWFLGDFIHHPEGLHSELLTQIARELQSWVDQFGLQIRFVPGNHDRKFKEWAKALPVTVEEKRIQREGFSFLHEPRENPDPKTYDWHGHLHPAVYLPILGSDKFPCFFIRKNEAYLPAFSRMAKGAEIGRLKPEDQVYAIVDDLIVNTTF